MSIKNIYQDIPECQPIDTKEDHVQTAADRNIERNFRNTKQAKDKAEKAHQKARRSYIDRFGHGERNGIYCGTRTTMNWRASYEKAVAAGIDMSIYDVETEGEYVKIRPKSKTLSDKDKP